MTLGPTIPLTLALSPKRGRGDRINQSSHLSELPPMLNQTRRAFLLSTCGAALVLAGCGDSGPQTNGAASNGPSGEIVLNRGNGAEPKSLDPHFTEGTWESAITGDLLMGLLTEDAEGKSIPGAATNWETSTDGKTWTFHLADHQWSDGMPVTAEDFIFAWRRILDPKTAAQYASLLYLFKNGEAINTGKMKPEELGAKATDAKTIVLELEHPVPYLTELMTHQTTFPVPKHAVEAKGDDWSKAGNYIGNGAYTLAEWVPNDHVTLVKNPKFFDAANVQIDRVVFYPTTDGDAALKRFRARELDVQDPLPASQIDWLKQNMPETLQIGPYLGTGYIVVNQTRRPFGDVRVRQALNLAYDRETVSEKIRRLGEPPAYTFVPPGIANYPYGNSLDFKELPYAERIKRAQGLMRQAGYSAEKRLKTTYSISTSPDARRSAAAIQQMWKEIYVDVELVPSEVQINYLKLQNGDYDIGGAGWVADFNDARNFLFLLMTNNGGFNYGRYKNAEFDKLMNASDLEPDLKKRGDLMARAEAIALKEYAWIPTLNLVTLNIVRPYVKGWVANVKDTHRTRFLSIDTAARAATAPA
uniref:Oligopeptide ABC transporter n=1 Tax=uncultured bacterium BLR7 TaxID=506523 RepID=C0INR1_9BACT|nr:oligopeptide ABC transporter [uncultured bacterium BLR7]